MHHVVTSATVQVFCAVTEAQLLIPLSLFLSLCSRGSTVRSPWTQIRLMITSSTSVRAASARVEPPGESLAAGAAPGPSARASLHHRWLKRQCCVAGTGATHTDTHTAETFCTDSSLTHARTHPSSSNAVQSRLNFLLFDIQTSLNSFTVFSEFGELKIGNQ